MLALVWSCSDDTDEAVRQAKTRIIAHRGYWRAGYAENSIEAMLAAEKIPVYGSEFDVTLTNDGVPVISHDPAIYGLNIRDAPFRSCVRHTSASVTDTQAVVCPIHKRLCDRHTSARVSDTRAPVLPTNERSTGDTAGLLTLSDFLDAAKQTSRIKLILDLKAHPEADVNRAAARICVATVEDRHMQDRVEYLAFSISGGRELVRIAPYAPVYYIGEDLPPAEVKANGFAGLGHDYRIILQRMNVFDEAKDEGMKLNIYTVNDTTLMREMTDREVDFITTDYPVEALEIIENKKY
jgi:glycerophosphoryl diester phosphodiesterase